MAAIQAQVGMKQYPVQPQILIKPLFVSHQPREEAKVDTLKWLTYLLQTRPMAFWSGVWVSVFLVAMVAVGSLISPNAAERRSVSAIAIGSDSVVATQPLNKKDQVPLWLFGAIAITCTAGSFLVSRQLSSKTPLLRKTTLRRRRPQKSLTSPQPTKHLSTKPRQPRRKATNHPQRLKPYSPSEPLFNRPQAQAVSPTQIYPPVAEPRPLSVPSFTVNRVKTQQHQGSKAQTQQRRALEVEMPELSKKPRSTANVPVTVVPEEHIHPLDWQAPRLADAVDLRRRKSINTWM